jgi:hypothetical protein
MKSTARLVACAVVTLVLTGVGSSAQALVSHGHRHTLHLGHVTTSHHMRLEQDGSYRVLRALGRLDRRLVHATSDDRLAPLTDADRDALLNNAEADEAAVEAVATSYSANPSDTHLADAKDVLRGYHAIRYVRATNIVRHSERTSARILALQPLVVAGSADETALANAAELLAGVPASGFSATTTVDAMHAARAAVAQARALVGQVQDDLASV